MSTAFLIGYLLILALSAAGTVLEFIAPDEDEGKAIEKNCCRVPQ